MKILCCYGLLMVWGCQMRLTFFAGVALELPFFPDLPGWQCRYGHDSWHHRLSYGGLKSKKGWILKKLCQFGSFLDQILDSENQNTYSTLSIPNVSYTIGFLSSRAFQRYMGLYILAILVKKYAILCIWNSLDLAVKRWTKPTSLRSGLAFGYQLWGF